MISVVLSLIVGMRRRMRTMSKDEIEQSLNQSWEKPDCVRVLKGIVQKIKESVPAPKTREMMYDLVDVVIQMGERVHDLEIRMVAYGARENLQAREERIRVDIKKGESTDLYRHKRH